MQQFKNLKEIINHFSEEQKCIDFLVQQRWGGCPVCPYCKSDKWYKIENGKRFKCANKECHKKYSVTVGTIFHASNIPLSTWFPAMYLISAHKKGISSCQIARDLGVTQKTAWFMLHRTREALHNKKSIFLQNTVEVDEIYIGGRIKNMSNKKRAAIKENGENYYENKSMVIGMIERGGELKLQPAPSLDKGYIEAIVDNNIDKKASLITDGEAVYKGVGQRYASHESVNHKIHEYVREGNIHTNTIEGAFGLFRRSIIGIYHKLSPKHLSRYCHETAYRYNSRHMKDGERFEKTFENIETRLSWKDLTKNNGLNADAIIQPSLPELNIGISGKKRAIVQMIRGEVIATFTSIVEAANITGIKKYAIARVVRGERKSAGGYVWKSL